MSETGLDALPRMYNRLFWLTWISYLWGIGFGLWTVWLVIQTTLNCLPGAHVQLDVPVNFTYPPHSGSISYGGSAYVLQQTAVTFTRASMLVAHLPIRNVILLGLGQIFASATSAGIAWCVWVLIRKLRDNKPFAESAARALLVAGFILGIGSSASTLTTAIGQLGLVIAYIPKYGDWSPFTNADPFIELTPLFFAGVLFALAGVFNYGARLQKDTEGLV